MKSIFENVIKKGGYNLESIVKKIDECYISGKITQEDATELTILARENANAKDSVDIFAKLVEFEKRIRAFEEKFSETEEYPAYVEGKWYYNGDKCSENGDNYICIAPEKVVCTWAPSKYPAYWEMQ